MPKYISTIHYIKITNGYITRKAAMFLDDITLANLKCFRICKVNSGGNDIRVLNVWVGHVRNDVLYNLWIAYCYCNRQLR